MSDTPNVVIIAGKSVDVNDPCALYAALFGYRMQLAAGGAVEEIELRTPLSTRRQRFSKGSSPADLDALLADLKAQCEAKNGIAPRRRRFAISGSFYPY